MKRHWNKLTAMMVLAAVVASSEAAHAEKTGRDRAVVGALRWSPPFARFESEVSPFALLAGSVAFRLFEYGVVEAGGAVFLGAHQSPVDGYILGGGRLELLDTVRADGKGWELGVSVAGGYRAHTHDVGENETASMKTVMFKVTLDATYWFNNGAGLELTCAPTYSFAFENEAEDDDDLPQSFGGMITVGMAFGG